MDVDNGDVEEKKRKREAYVTSGCGYGQSKKRILHAFDNALWPILANGGWTKIEGTGEHFGLIYFMPPGVELAPKYARNKQYAERVKEVIDRVLERRNKLESRAADAYMDEVGDLVKVTAGTRRQQLRRAAKKDDVGSELVGTNAGVSDEHHVSMAWKDDRKHFPKISSRVGRRYQVEELPIPGSSTSAEDEMNAHSYDLVWDPEKARTAGNLNLVHSKIPFAKKEFAMVALHKYGYDDEAGFRDDVEKAIPLDGSDWTDEERNTFREAIFEYRKDPQQVAKKMGKSVCNVMTHYLGAYKQSDDYRLLKVVCQQEGRGLENGVDPDDDVCQICKEGGHLLICDRCEMAYHTACLKPPLKQVPEGDWECDFCLDEKVLNARDSILGKSDVVFVQQNEIDAQPDSTVSGSKLPADVMYSDQAKKATLRFAEAFRKALAT